MQPFEILNFGKDRNGNTIVKVRKIHQRAFSIQTNNNLPKAHRFANAMNLKFSELVPIEISLIRDEIYHYIINYGTPNQKR